MTSNDSQPDDTGSAERCRNQAQQALARERETLLRAVIESMADGILVEDDQGKVLLANRRFSELWRIPPALMERGDDQAIQGFLLRQLADAGAFLRQVQALRGSDAAAVDTLAFKDGRLLERNSRAMKADGVRLGRVWSFRDISAHKQAEKLLRESREYLQIVLDSTTDAIFVEDPETGQILHVNRRVSEMYGYSYEESLHTPISVFSQGSSPYSHAEALRWHERARTLGPQTFEGFARRKNGELFWTEVNIRSMTFGTAERIVVTVRDIAERKRAEDALRQKEVELRGILDTTADGILAVDHQGKVIKMNQRFADLWHIPLAILTGGDDQALMNHILEQLSAPDVFLEKMQALSDAAEDDMDTLVFKDGRVFERYSSPLMMERALIGRVWSFRDITERRRAEEEKARLEAQLQQAQKMELVGRLAGGVAHDFNNKLGVILGYAELALMKTDPDQPIRADLEEICRATLTSADLTRQLLAFARKQMIAPRSLNLNRTVSAMLRMLQRLIGEDIDLVWLPDPNLWPVRADPSQVDQILTNLCVNARDAITGIGRITIETGNCVIGQDDCTAHAGSMPGAYVRLAVRDTGCGMAQDVIAHAFEPFFTTKEVGKGTGLGLATVYGCVAQNNGFVNVSSEPGSGTTFTVYLPRLVHDDVADAAVGNAAAPLQGHGETVLLAEDEQALRTTCGRFLEDLGYRVLAAESSADALDLAVRHPGEIHLLLTDVIMPGMNGRQLAEQIGSIRPECKVLFMSGHTADTIAHQGVLDAGVHFIQKPFSHDDLARHVHEALVAP